MTPIVAKFGGSSLASAEQVRKVAGIVRADRDRRYVVVSAPGGRYAGDTKVTDLLYRCYDLAAAGKPFEPALEEIRTRFIDIIEGLGVDFDLDGELEILRRSLKEDPRRDYTASRGEYLSAKLLAVYLDFPFADAAELICFDRNGVHQDDGTQKKMSEALAGMDRAVIPGFYGADETGTIHTFSRGGSDVTGALAARAAGARVYENWTDVSGILRADPRIVPDAGVMDTITYKELRELSYMGASVLHEDAVFPVRRAGIPISVRNTNRPDDPGTMVRGERPVTTPRRAVTGIAGKKGFSVLEIEKAMMNTEVGFCAEVLRIFKEHGVSIEHCPTGIDTMSVVVASDLFAPHRDEIQWEIMRRVSPDSMVVEDHLSVIAVVGYGMTGVTGSAFPVFRAVYDAGVSLRMASIAPNELTIILGVADRDYEAAIRAIYNGTE